VGTHDITCRELVEVVTDFLEGALPVEERDLVERHLAMCTWCQTYLDQMQHALAVAGRLREDDVPPPMLDALVRAFRAQRARPDGV
jgi:predicted anti-sigma-YlaC factor YlaD